MEDKMYRNSAIENIRMRAAGQVRTGQHMD
jgi:hypothetical protein